MGKNDSPHMGSVPHLLMHLRGSADFNDITGMQWTAGGWLQVQGMARGLCVTYTLRGCQAGH